MLLIMCVITVIRSVFVRNKVIINYNIIQYSRHKPHFIPNTIGHFLGCFALFLKFSNDNFCLSKPLHESFYKRIYVL